jgi:hypothetical protein
VSKAAKQPAQRVVEKPPAPDGLTMLSSRLLLAIAQAQIELQNLSGLTPRRSARAEVLAQLLKNIRTALLDA